MSEALDRQLLDRFQRDFPLEPRPFAAISERLAIGEDDLLSRIARLMTDNLIDRVGAVVRPNTVGASTLAALSAPRDRLEAVAAVISASPWVNHNYERNHRLNLWFVVTAPDRATVGDVLAGLERETGCAVLDLPLEHAYHIDLGFPLDGAKHRIPAVARPRRPATESREESRAVSDGERALLAALEHGLPLVAEPYRAVADRLGWSEAAVIETLRRLLTHGIVRRFGLVVRHRALGYRANAMVVWNVPDSQVDRVAGVFASHDFVTLCYRRPRRMPEWPYNLFCMIHGSKRDVVLGQVSALNLAADSAAFEQAVLFSRRCFKQRGARYLSPQPGGAS